MKRIKRICFDCTFRVILPEDVADETNKRCKKGLWQDESIILINGSVAKGWASNCHHFEPIGDVSW